MDNPVDFHRNTVQHYDQFIPALLGILIGHLQAKSLFNASECYIQ